jgi:hypothetical protein
MHCNMLPQGEAHRDILWILWWASSTTFCDQTPCNIVEGTEIMAMVVTNSSLFWYIKPCSQPSVEFPQSTLIYGARGSVAGWGTMLQAGR